MRIGIISTISGYPWAGSEELWFAAAQRFREKGHPLFLHLSSAMRSAEPIEGLIEAGVSATFRKSMHPRLTQLKNKFYSDFLALERFKADAILVSAGSPHDLWFLPGLVDFLSHQSIPYILLCQFNADSLHFSPEMRDTLVPFHEKASGLVYVSHQNLELARRQFARNLPEAAVISNPIRNRINKPLPFPRLTEDSPVRFAMVARMETLWKGHDILLQCLASPKWRKRNWELRLYGNGPDQAYVRDLVRHYGLTDRVFLEGYVRDLNLIWAENHIHLLASRGEGMPLAILESMHLGRPAIMTRVGGSDELIIEGKTGFLAACPDSTVFATAMEKAWEHRDTWEEMGKNAHEHVGTLTKTDPGESLFQRVTAIAEQRH